MRYSTFKLEGETVYRTGSGYVIHFLSIKKPDHKKHGTDAVRLAYDTALNRARDYGSRRFDNTSFGGGIQFGSIEELKQFLDKVSDNEQRINS